jgi:hypothetical protein
VKTSRPPLRVSPGTFTQREVRFARARRHAPSLRSELFGSWLCSLESLVEVQRLALLEREHFIELVTQQQELHSLSPHELEAWWFQLNRAHHFAYDYYLKLDKTPPRFEIDEGDPQKLTERSAIKTRLKK